MRATRASQASIRATDQQKKTQELEAEKIVNKETITLVRAQKKSLICENHWITKDLKRVISKKELTIKKLKVKNCTLKKTAKL